MLFFVFLLSAEGTCQVRSTASTSFHERTTKTRLEFHLKPGPSAVPPAVWIKRSQQEPENFQPLRKQM